jgi:hypothetical protein
MTKALYKSSLLYTSNAITVRRNETELAPQSYRSCGEIFVLAAGIVA